MSTLYDDSSFVAYHPTDISPWNYSCLSVNGYNRMLVPMKVPSGDPGSPTYSFTQDNRTGIYNPGEGQVGVSLFGYPSVIFKWGGVDLVDLHGRVGTITTTLTGDRTWTLPDNTGTLALLSDIPGGSGSPSAYSSSSVTTLISITGVYGRVDFFDSLGGYAYIRYFGSTLTIEGGSSDWLLTSTPTSSQVGVYVTGGNLTMKLGSSAARSIRIVYV